MDESTAAARRFPVSPFLTLTEERIELIMSTIVRSNRLGTIAARQRSMRTRDALFAAFIAGAAVLSILTLL